MYILTPLACQGQTFYIGHQTQDIKRDYTVGDSTVHALKGVNLEFRETEFVAILGHSGCGKTTLLNIIGGLDQYTSGDLIINNKSTKTLLTPIGIPTATIPLALSFSPTTSSRIRPFFQMSSLR